jgi:PAS domain S-box-containing protein
VAGQSRTYLSTKGAFRDAGGNVAGIIGISRDITDRKRAEVALRRSEERFRRLAEGIDFIPWEADLATWRFTYVGPQAVKILGYPLEDWYRDGFWVDHIHPEDRVWVADYCATNSATRRHYRFEYKMLASDGRTVWLDDIVSVTEDEDGTKLLQGVMVDVSERKRMEEELRRSEERFRSLVQNASDVITVVDAEGTILYVSPAVKRVLGYEPEEMIGESALAFGHPDDREEAMRLLAELSARPGIQPTFEVRVPHKDGSWRCLEHTANNLLEDPNVGGIVVNQHDITERKRAQAAEFEIREAERRRISRDLHDGVLQDLALVTQRLEMKRLVDESDSSDDGLGPEIDSLRGAVRGLRAAIYELRPYEAVPFIREVEAMARHERELTPEREIGVVVEDGFPAELPEAGANQLQRLIREALTNARRHSAARHIRVLLGATEDELWAEVSDDGRGIEPGRSGGGLGLSTMKERATLLGGNLEIRSEPGTGTRVRLRMPHPLSGRS